MKVYWDQLYNKQHNSYTLLGNRIQSKFLSIYGHNNYIDILIHIQDLSILCPYKEKILDYLLFYQSPVERYASY